VRIPLGDELEAQMSPELWVALAVGVVPTIGTVVVAWINRRRHAKNSELDQ
jgi:hypothetical protein